MSLVQGRWILVGAAGTLAAAIPFWLLQPGKAAIDAAPPLVVTQLEVAPVGGIELARSAPIFSPQRALPAAAAPTLLAGEAAAAPPAAAAPAPVLVGIISRARGRGVALVKRADGQTVTLAPGASVDGWRLAAIGRDRATFTANGERRIVALDFSNKAPPAAAAFSAIPSPPPGPGDTPPPGQLGTPQ